MNAVRGAEESFMAMPAAGAAAGAALGSRGAGGTDRVIDSKTGEILHTQKRKRGR